MTKKLLRSYLPQDRYRALCQRSLTSEGIALTGELPSESSGSVLFADISGFTPLTERLVNLWGSRRGAEYLSTQLNRVYEALIGEVETHGGSVVAFAGDAISCYFADGKLAGVLRAFSCALKLQGVMKNLNITIGEQAFELGLKVAVASGSFKRLIVGKKLLQDVLFGEALERITFAENLISKGEIALDTLSFERLYAQDNVLLKTFLNQALQTQGYYLFPEAVLKTQESHLAMTTLETQLHLDGINLLDTIKLDDIKDDKLEQEDLKAWLLPSVYERLKAGYGDFLTELRPCVALFCRFEGLDKQLGELNVLMERLEPILEFYEASLIQLSLGDKGSFFYVAFGAPIAHEDDAERALKTAWELKKAFEGLTLKLLGMGMSKGSMRTGAYGSRSRQTYGVLGDAVNLAARLMMKAEAGEILLDEAMAQIAQSLTGEYALKQLEPLPLKGKTGLFKAFLLEPKPARDLEHPLGLENMRYSLPMVGREKELKRLITMIKLSQQAGQLIILKAEAGMGKSRLIAELIREPSLKGFSIYLGEAQSYGQNMAYFAWRNIFRGLLGLGEGGEGLEPLLKKLNISNAKERLALLAPLLNLELEESQLSRQLESKLRQEATESLIIEIFSAALKSASQGSILILEDAHWLDGLSKTLLNSLGRMLSSLPVALVVVHRPLQEHEKLLADLDHQEIILEGLDSAAIQSLLANKARQLDLNLSEELRQALSTKSEGNPFYLEELLNFLKDHQVDLTKLTHLNELELPDSLHSLILSRIDKLIEAHKTTLKTASVIGRVFSYEHLWRYYQRADEAQLKDYLSHLERLDITPLDNPEPELRYLFKHIILQEVVYESLSSEIKTQLHELYAQYLETYHKHELDLLAYHYGRSENLAKQRVYFKAAAKRAFDNFATGAALDYYQAYLELLEEEEKEEKATVLYHIAQLHENQGDIQKSLSIYPEALNLAQDNAYLALKLSYEYAFLEHMSGNPDLAHVHFQSIIEKSKALGFKDILLNTSVYMLMLQITSATSYQKLEQDLQESLELAKEQGDLGAQATLLGLLCDSTYFSSNDLLKARAYIDEAIILAERLNNPHILQRIYRFFSGVLFAQEDLPGLADCCNKELMTALKIGRYSINYAMALQSSAVYQYVRKDFKQAKELLIEAITLAQNMNFLDPLADWNMRLGDALMELEEYELAEEVLDKGLDYAKRLHNSYETIFAYMKQGTVYTFQNNFDEAIVKFKAVVQSDAERLFIPALLALVYACLQKAKISHEMALKIWNSIAKDSNFSSSIQDSIAKSSLYPLEQVLKAHYGEALQPYPQNTEALSLEDATKLILNYC
ncbi:MAG: adenylate/guanylate cyclase domain-containing protein [Deinococcales bacterium]